MVEVVEEAVESSLGRVNTRGDCNGKTIEVDRRGWS